MNMKTILMIIIIITIIGLSFGCIGEGTESTYEKTSSEQPIEIIKSTPVPVSTPSTHIEERIIVLNEQYFIQPHDGEYITVETYRTSDIESMLKKTSTSSAWSNVKSYKLIDVVYSGISVSDAFDDGNVVSVYVLNESEMSAFNRGETINTYSVQKRVRFYYEDAFIPVDARIIVHNPDPGDWFANFDVNVEYTVVVEMEYYN